MKNTQKGFAIPLIIALVALVAIGGGVYIYNQNNLEAPRFDDFDNEFRPNIDVDYLNNQDGVGDSQSNNLNNNQPVPDSTSITQPQAPVVTTPQSENNSGNNNETRNWNTYRNDALGFKFKYPPNFTVKQTYRDTGSKIDNTLNDNFQIFNGSQFNIEIGDWITLKVNTADYSGYRNHHSDRTFTGNSNIKTLCKQEFFYNIDPVENTICKLMRAGDEEAVFKVGIYPGVIGSYHGMVNVFLNNRNNIKYPGIDFKLKLDSAFKNGENWLGCMVGDVTSPLCEMYTGRLLASNEAGYVTDDMWKNLYKESDIQVLKTLESIFENINLSNEDATRLKIFNQVISTFRFID